MCEQTIATIADTRKWNCSCFDANLAILHQFPVAGRCSNHLPIGLPFTRLSWSKAPNLLRDFDAICRNSADISISGFGGQIAIFGCRSTFRHFSELSTVVNPRFSVGISILLASAIQTFPVAKGWWNSSRTVSPMRSKTQVCCWNFDYIYHSFGDISTSGTKPEVPEVLISPKLWQI